MAFAALPWRQLVNHYLLSIHFAGQLVTLVTRNLSMSALK